MAERVAEGQTVKFRPHGNSMTPLIESGQLVTVEPIDLETAQLAVGDIVLARVKGVMRLHLVTAIDLPRRRAQISNNHGLINGWTGFDRVFGKCVKVED